MIIQYLYHH